MKQLIAPIAIIVALIAVFVIIDRKEFSRRHDNVQTIQSESPTTNRKPTVSVPETKPVTESKSAVEAKPVETKPEEKPLPAAVPVVTAEEAEKLNEFALFLATEKSKTTVVEGEITDRKPTVSVPETKLVTESKSAVEAKHFETKPEEKLLPAAVPVVTAEKAEKLNEFALFLATEKSKITVVEGEITERSVLPDPKDTDYPDCRYTAHFVGNTIISGMPCNKELSLSIDGFKDKQLLSTNNLKAGDKIRCAIVPMDSIPVEFASIEEADDLFLFQLENYLLVSYKTIVSFSDIIYNDYHIDFKDSEYISIFDRRINPEVGELLKEKQEEVIYQEKERIKKILFNYSNDQKKEINQRFFKAWAEEQKNDPPGFNRIKGYVWRNMNGSFFALPEEYELIGDYPLLSQNNIDSLVSLRDFLETQGVQLLVSLIPHYYDIAARVINKEFQSIPDFRTAIIVNQLLDNNIEATYISNEIIRNYNKHPFAFFYPFDDHPADVAQDVSSGFVAERLSRFAFPKAFDENDFNILEKIHTYLKPAENYIYPSNCDIGKNKAGEPYLCNQILYHNHAVGRTYSDSPILIMSNSFGDTPSGSSFSDYLSMKSGIKNFTYIVPGRAVVSTAMHRLFNHPEKFLKGKKILVLHLGLNDLLSCFIPNFRDLDAIKKIECNLALKKSLVLVGNEKGIPDFAQNLKEPFYIFKIDEKKEQTIINTTIDDLSLNLDYSKNLFVVIDYVCLDSDKLTLTCNSVEKPLSGTYYRYRSSSKISFSIPNSIENCQISVHGRPGAVIAIQSIKLYQ